MNNFKVHCRKTWQGCVDVRDHNVKKCIAENRNIEVTCDVLDGVMILTPSMLENPKMISKKEFTSQFDNKKYKLYSYQWNPK